jgi:uncharacterized membrane protein YeaQ/YmgE (transglycosylase-associated protein family)
MGTIPLALLAGIIIGPLARLVLPGKQNISVLMTIVLGAVGALAGSWIYRLISGKSDTSGIDWIAFGIGVVVAALAITAYVAFTGRNKSGAGDVNPTGGQPTT